MPYLILLFVQVLQLRVENSSLLKRLTDLTQKYNDASVDKRVLKADVETLRAKVKPRLSSSAFFFWLNHCILISDSDLS